MALAVTTGKLGMGFAAVAATVIAGGAVVFAASSNTGTASAAAPKPSYTMSIPTQTVNQTRSGALADFDATIVPGAGDYPDPVSLTVKDLPKGVTYTWDFAPVVTAGSDPTRHLFLTIPSTLKVDTYQFTVHSVNDTSGKDAHDTKVTLGVAAAVAPSSSFTLSASPSARTVQQGGTATYTAQLNVPSGYNGGDVTFSAGGAPGGTTPSFVPTKLSAPPGGTSTLTIATNSKTKPGQYNVKISGKNAKTHVDILVTLTVQAVGGSGFTLAVSPTQQQVAAGGTTSYAIGISRAAATDEVLLQVSGQPTGATATLEMASSLSSSATLTVTTDEVTTPDGNFDLTVTGTSGSLTRTVVAKLVVKTPNGVSVGISGDATGAPLTLGGPAAPINLQLSNPNDKPIWITNVQVEVASTNKAGCTAADFVSTQYSGGYPLLIAKKSSATLSSLGVPSSTWPTVRLINTASNQDGCKGAVAQLAYTASARQAT
jgi:hypothetical protein